MKSADSSSKSDLKIKMSGLDKNLSSMCIPLRINLFDANDHETAASNIISFVLRYTAAHSISFFSDSGCSASLTTADQILNIGESQKYIYYQIGSGGTDEPVQISIDAIDTNSGKSLTVDDLMTEIQNYSSYYELVIFYGNATPTSCSFISIEYCVMHDGPEGVAGTGVVVNSDVDVQINLSAPFDEVTYYDDSSCTHQVTSLTMTAASGSVNGYYKLNPAMTFQHNQGVWMRASGTYHGVETTTPQTAVLDGSF